MACHKKVHEAALQGEPEASRHVEQEGLDQEVDGDPLVVGVEQVGVAKIGPGVGALSLGLNRNKIRRFNWMTFFFSSDYFNERKIKQNI